MNNYNKLLTKLLYFFYFLFIGPFFIYVGFFEKTGKFIHNTILFFGCFILITYGYEILKNSNNVNNKKVKEI